MSTSGTNKIMIGDRDGLIALISEKDANHKVTFTIVKRSYENDIEIVYPAAIVAEAIVALIRKYKDQKRANIIIDQTLKEPIRINDTTHLTLKKAATFYNPHKTAKDTYFDTIVAATAIEYKTNLIFPFDKFYKKINFTLAKEFL